MNLFIYYDEYYNFMTKNILSLQGYQNIFQIIQEIISIFANNREKADIIIDNYDDHLVGNTKLSSIYIDKLYGIIKDKDIKILFIGRGKFISNLLKDYFYNKNNIKSYLLFKYYNTLGLDIDNIIHTYYKVNDTNEI